MHAQTDWLIDGTTQYLLPRTIHPQLATANQNFGFYYFIHLEKPVLHFAKIAKRQSKIIIVVYFSIKKQKNQFKDSFLHFTFWPFLSLLPLLKLSSADMREALTSFLSLSLSLSLSGYFFLTLSNSFLFLSLPLQREFKDRVVVCEREALDSFESMQVASSKSTHSLQQDIII